MTSKLTREENVQAVFDLKAGYTLGLADVEILKRVARRALAAMDSEPVYQVFEPSDGRWVDVDDEDEMIRLRSIGGETRTLYTAPPSTVVDSEPVGEFYEDGPLNWYQISDGDRVPSHRRIPLYRHAQQPVVPDEIEPDHDNTYDYVDGWNACLAAMLQAEPVMTANKLPETQFKQVADLYEMQFDDGRTCAFHTDAEKAVQWLNTCDGNKVQEYVKLERLHDAVSGNSPVIPDGYVMVPKEPTPEILAAINEAIKSMRGSAATYARVLAAAPQEMMKDEANNLSQK